METRPKQTEGNASRNFQIRSFSKAQESPNWEINQLDNNDESNKPKSEVVLMNSNNSTETELTDKQNNLKPEVLFKEVVQVPIQNKRSGETIIGKQITPAMKSELSVDLNVKDDPGDLKTSPGNNVNMRLDQASCNPVQKRKERSDEEILVADIKQRSPTRIKELSVDLHVEKDPDILEDPVKNVNTVKFINWDTKGLDPLQKGKERAVDEIITTDFKQRSPTRMEDLSVNLDFKKDPDILEVPVNKANTSKCIKWDSKDSVQEEKEGAEEDITFADFKRRSPTSMKKLSIDLNDETKPDIAEDLKDEPVHSEVHQDEVRLEDMKRAEFPESVLRNKRNEAARGKSEFDVELRESVSTNHKISKAMGEIGEPEHEDEFQARKDDESGISESNILASVYARATLLKSGVLKTPFAQDPMHNTADVIPTIVIMPSESEEPKVIERKWLTSALFQRQIQQVLSLSFSRFVFLFFNSYIVRSIYFPTRALVLCLFPLYCISHHAQALWC